NTPGVLQAASTYIVPVSGSGWNEMIEILGQPPQKRMVPWFNQVSDGYLRTMGTPLIAGRNFDEHDTTTSPPVAIVNEKFSEKFLGKGNPLGKQIHVLVGPNEPQRVYQIVGLMKNSKYQGLREEFQ